MKLNLPRTPSYSSKPRERFAHHRLSSRANGRRVFQATQKCTNCESKNSPESKRSFADRRAGKEGATEFIVVPALGSSRSSSNGNFPGGLIELEFVFTLNGNKIVSLEIRS